MSKTKKTLEQRVAERISFLKTVTAFVIKITEKYGKLRYIQGSAHTNIVAELWNFGDFSFHTNTGKSTMGGNNVEIWHHPGKVYKDRAMSVLKIYWQTEISATDCIIYYFNQNYKWQKAILRLIKDKKIAKRIVMANELAKKKKAQKKIQEDKEAERQRLIRVVADKLAVT